MQEADTDSKEKIRKSLHHSVMDGFFWSIMVGFGESFFSAFAVFLKATNSQIGLIGSLPQALGSLSQLLSRKLLAWTGSRKRVVLIGVLLSALAYLPITLVFFLGKMSVPLLLFFVCLYWIASTVMGPAWNSWMGDLVDKNERGAYFGRRNRIAGFATFFSFILAGYILQQFGGNQDRQYLGYCIIFVVALVARLFSFAALMRQHEPPYHDEPSAYFSFWQFMKRARFNNYGIFVIYNAFMNFGVYISGPFFTAYMLRSLGFSYIQYTVIQAAAILMRNLSMPIWGKAMDRFGAKKVLTLSGYLMPIVPILWAVSRNYYYLIGVQLYSGLVWAAFDLSVFTFVFDITTPQKRATCVAYFNVMNGATTLAGAMVGGLLITYLPANALGSSYLVLFIFSGIIRYMSSFIFLPKIREVRLVEPISYHVLLYNVVTNIPTTGSFVFNFIQDVVTHPTRLPASLIKEVSVISRELTAEIRRRSALRKKTKQKPENPKK